MPLAHTRMPPKGYVHATYFSEVELVRILIFFLCCTFSDEICNNFNDCCIWVDVQCLEVCMWVQFSHYHTNAVSTELWFVDICVHLGLSEIYNV